mmetsp:Transcript_93422/g.264500  ORF Transcript_93422/g.264500 Transcript_93422/m.264500 type:complete len:223 (+) Transcript_93422:496-1164(+)
MCKGGFGNCLHALVRWRCVWVAFVRRRVAVRDVLRDRQPEEHRLLRDECHLVAQVAGVQAPDIVAIDEEAPASHLVEPDEQRQHCGLPSPARPNEGVGGVHRDFNAEPLKHQHVLPGRVGENDILEGDVALDRCLREAPAGDRDPGRPVDELEGAARRADGDKDLRDQPQHHADTRADLDGIQHESRQLPHSEVAFDHQACAEPHDKDASADPNSGHERDEC